MIPVFKPYMPHQLDELNNILYSGALSYGKWGREFEKRIAEFINAEFVLTTNSYNSALLVLITTLGLKPGDEILASPMSCLASNQPFINKGLSVRWVDIDPYRGTMDPESVKKKITKNTKAIFHNHFCGIPGYIDEINDLAKEHGLFVVDDCIEAFGSSYKGNIVGNTGADAAVYSFQTVRLPNTIDGGGLIFKDAKLFEMAKRIRDYGIDRSTFRDKYHEIDPFSDIELEGYGALMSEINSYIGCKQMPDISLLLAQQKANAEIWKKYFEQFSSNISPVVYNNDAEPNFWVYGVITTDKIKHLVDFRKMGYYATGVHVNNDVYSVFGKQDVLKGVASFVNNYLALPCGWWIKDNELPYVAT